MSVDKLVDSTQLDSDLTSVANAIRTKGGTSASLAFPSDFVSAIEAIPTGGGGFSVEQIARIAGITGDLVFTEDIGGGTARYAAFRGCTGITKIISKHEFALNTQMFYGCTSLTQFITPNAILVPAVSDVFRASSSLSLVDWGKRNLSLMADSFRDCNALSVIILRKSDSCATLANANTFRNCTPIQSGGSGVTIYIPKVLYDELGTGGTLDYKVKTNWSTLDGYGTITWAKLEGSIYESETWWES